MESLKKYFKLLCCVFITLFVFGIGGEKVLAEPDLLVKYGGFWLPRSNGRAGSLIKTDPNGNYIFCLDSNLDITTFPMPYKTSLSGNYVSGYEENLKKLFTKAYQMGLGNGSSHTIKIVKDNETIEYTVSDIELYGIVQSAVWHYAHGDGVIGGLDDNHRRFIDDTSHPEYKAFYEKLLEEKVISGVSLVQSGADFSLTKPSDDATYMESKEFELLSDLPDNVEYTATVTGGSMSINGGDYTTSNATVHPGDKIKLKYDIPDTNGGTVSVSLNVTTSEYVNGADIKLYEYSGAQSIVAPSPKTTTSSADAKVTGNYVNTKEIRVFKNLDSMHGKGVAGALLEFYNYDNSVKTPLGSFYSTADGTPFTNLQPGTYCVREISAPAGYALNKTPSCIEFNSNQTDNMTMNISDKKRRVMYRKVDENGNPMGGAEIKLINYAKKLAKKDDYVYICAKSNPDNGYFTLPCSDSKYSTLYQADGIYDLQSDENSQYIIEEEFMKGYENSIYYDDNQDFWISDRSFGTSLPAADFVTLTGDLETDEIVTVNIKNKRSLRISKTDTGTGAEVPGAKMILYYADVKDLSGAQDSGIPFEQASLVAIESWTSTEDAHIFTGVIPGQHYILSEIASPDGYAKLQTDIEFTVDDNGKVELINKVQQVKVGDNSKYGDILVIGNDLIVNAPNTGISLLNKIAIGGLMVFVGYEAIKIYRKRTA